MQHPFVQHDNTGQPLRHLIDASMNRTIAKVINQRVEGARGVHLRQAFQRAHVEMLAKLGMRGRDAIDKHRNIDILPQERQQDLHCNPIYRTAAD